MRLNSEGKDELSALARMLNMMLSAIQKTKADLIQAQESLRFHAEHDALTGALNRRAIRDVLRKELARCRRERNTLGVILGDVVLQSHGGVLFHPANGFCVVSEMRFH